MSGNMLLDSNIVVYLAKGELDWQQFLDETTTYYVSVISYMETLGFQFASVREKEFIQHFLALFQIVYIDQQIADRVVAIRQQKRIKLPDAIIAATALETQCTLVTRNTDDFKNIDPQLRVINPFQS